MNSAARPAPAVRRAYFDCRFGQLHVYQAIPAGGGFDEATAVICVPGADGTAAVFTPWLPLLGLDRSMYALDLPGSGMSDGASGGSRAGNAALAVSDFMSSMRVRRAHLLTRATSADAVRALTETMAGSFERLVIWDDSAALKALPGAAPLPRLLLDSAPAPAGQLAQLRQFLG